jgi:hypothetical protein
MNDNTKSVAERKFFEVDHKNPDKLISERNLPFRGKQTIKNEF